MKTPFQILIAVTLILSSCGNNIDSVDPKNLKTPCDCAHAVEVIFTEQLDVKEETAGKDMKEIDTAKMISRIKKYMALNKEVSKICQGNLDVKKCPEWKSIKEKTMNRDAEIDQEIRENMMKSEKN